MREPQTLDQVVVTLICEIDSRLIRNERSTELNEYRRGYQEALTGLKNDVPISVESDPGSNLVARHYLTSHPDYGSLGDMSSSDVLAYLIDKQRDEQIPGFVMAARLGMGETNWSHARRGRRRLTVGQIERAMRHYPEIVERFAIPESVEAKAS